MEVYSWKIIKRNGDYHRVTSKNGDDVEYLMAICDGMDSKRYDKLDNDEKIHRVWQKNGNSHRDNDNKPLVFGDTPSSFSLFLCRPLFSGSV